MIKLIILWVALLLFACTSQPGSNKEKHFGKLFIIGGGERTTAVLNRMADEAGLRQGGNVLILPMASSERDSAIYYAEKQFREIGINAVSSMIFDSASVLTPGMLDSIANARLIYITGGDQSRFMKAVRDNAGAEAIRTSYMNGNMIAGTSAGAAVMSELMITGNEMKNKNYNETFRRIIADNIELKPGLGLVTSAIIDQHFIWRSRHNRLITAILEHPELIGVGIDEATAILVSSGWAEVVGNAQVVVYRNKRKSAKLSPSGYLGGSLTVDIYLPGERFGL